MIKFTEYKYDLTVHYIKTNIKIIDNLMSRGKGIPSRAIIVFTSDDKDLLQKFYMNLLKIDNYPEITIDFQPKRHRNYYFNKSMNRDIEQCTNIVITSKVML